MSLIFQQLSQQVRSQALLKTLYGGVGANTASLSNSGDALCFFPGRRTRDDGSLGSNDGRVILKTSSPLADQVVRWRIITRGGDVVDEVATPAPHEIELLAAHSGRFRLELTLEGATLEPCRYEVSAPAFVSVMLDPNSIGVVLDELGVAADGQQRQALVDGLVAVARRVAAHALRPMNVRLLWPDDDIPAHFLPSAPVQAPMTPCLATAKAVEESEDNNSQQYYPGLRLLHVGIPQKVLPSIPVFEEISNILDARFVAFKDSIMNDLRARFGGRLNAALDELDAMFTPESVDTGWGTSSLMEAFGIGQVLFGGGARQFDGEAVGAGSSVAHQILATLAGAAHAEAWDVARDATSLYVEMAGRMLGTQIAVATLRLTGLQAREVALPDPENPGQTLHTDLLDPAPSVPERDFLGLYRPEANGIARSLDTLAGDLATQASPADSSRWVDLCKTIASPTATLIGAEPTTKYDALAGLVSERSLSDVNALAGTLPAPYGPYTLRWGDQDRPDGAHGEALPVYGGKTFSADERPVETREIELLQADLLRAGITLGQRTIGKFGYRRWTANEDKWDGALGAQPVRVTSWERKPDDPDNYQVNIRASRPHWNELCDGDTSIAVREFQIAETYPRGVMEEVSPEPVFVKRLRDVFQDEEQVRPDGDALAQPNGNVNGMLSPAMADKVRAWAFSRRRIPAVVIGGSHNDAYGAVDADHPFIQTAMSAALDAHPRISNNYRFYSVDKTGRFGATDEPVKLGRPSYSDGTARRGFWGGLWHPDDDEMPQKAFTAAHTFSPVDWELSPDLADEDRSRLRRRQSAFRMVAALAKVESISYWDGFNAWDDAIFSWPPFHYTLTLRANSGDGGVTASPNLMGGVIEFMRNPPDEVLEGAYPAPESSGDPDADAAALADVIAHRQALKTRMRECYWDNFGVYGVGASAITSTTSPNSFVTLSGLIEAQDSNRTVDMNLVWQRNGTGLPQQALYQSYQQWFRSWNWGQRFALHLRNKPLLRAMTFAYSLHWAHGVLALNSHWRGQFGIATNGNAVLRSERGRVVYIRLYIRALEHAADARRALGRLRGNAASLAQFHRNTTEEQIVDAMVNSATGALRRTTSTARDFNVPDGLGRPSSEDQGDNAAADFSQVRNELLRDVMTANWDNP